MRIFKGAIFLFILAAAIGFALQNDQPVSLRYYFGWETLPLPLFLWAFLSFLIGLIISGLMSALSKINLHSRIRQQKKGVAELERKRNALRTNHSPS
jgi:uncharacterized integral membrane protein